jgi:hypothetical protein
MLVPRVLPQRWWSFLLAVVVCAIAIVSTAARQARRDGLGLDLNAALLPLAAGIAGGIVLGFILIAYFSSHDTRLLLVRAARPGIVVQGIKDAQTFVWLGPIATTELNGNLAIERLFTVAFDRTGVTMWRGTRAPELIATVAWSEVIELGLGDLLERKGYGQTSYHRLRMVVLRNGEPVTVQFGIEHVPRYVSTRHVLNESEIVDLVTEVSKLRSGGIAPVQPQPSYVSAGLTPGMPAWSAGRILRLPLMTIMWISQIPFVAGLASLFLKGPLLTTVGCFVAWGLFCASAWTVVFLEGAAVKRERAAGYTTLNGVELAVEQRHPRTGVVIRPAGAPAIPKARFAEILRT